MTLMQDEIREQPVVLERSLKAGRAIAQNLARRINHFRPDFVFIAARGSSDNAATFARYIFEAYTGLPVSLAAPSLFTLYHRHPNLKKAWVIGVSQSGRSEDIVEVVREGRKQGALTLALTNDPNSPLAQAAGEVLNLNAGQEHSVAATKTYTTELGLLALLAAEISDDNGLRMGLERLPTLMNKALQQEERIRLLVNQDPYKNARHCLTLGRGYNYATALELALKLKETGYIFAAPYSTADFLHGPFALAEQSLPAIVVGANGPAIPGLLELGQKLNERGVEIVSIGDDEGLLKLATSKDGAFPLDLTGLPEALSPIVCVVPGQLFAMHLALARGYNPDEPRGLKKVTITK